MHHLIPIFALALAALFILVASVDYQSNKNA